MAFETSYWTIAGYLIIAALSLQVIFLMGLFTKNQLPVEGKVRSRQPTVICMQQDIFD